MAASWTTSSEDHARVPAVAYSYLLGAYLGDGCISRDARTYRMRIALDAKYPGIIGECVDALEALRPTKRASRHQRRSSHCVDVGMYWSHWPCLFPQHGAGRKHTRPINLEPWQRAIIASRTQEFARGLLHTDGCRVVANDRGVPSVRYHFSNRSEDIKRIFCDALDLLEIPWTRSCARQIAIYRKSAVARLDEFVGPSVSPPGRVSPHSVRAGL